MVNNAKGADISVGDNMGPKTKGRKETKREYTGWKEWFNSVFMGGDYGRWEIPWRASAPGSSKEGTPKWGTGPSSTKPAKETETKESKEDEHSTTSSVVASATSEPQTFTKIATPSIISGPWEGNKTSPHRPDYSGHGWPRPAFGGNRTKDNETEGGREGHKRGAVDLLDRGSKSTLTKGDGNNKVEVLF